MSTYENYREVSPSYDGTRAPVAAELILGCFARNERRLDEQRILDAGCGTGNYSAVLLEHVDRIAAVDVSAAMLAIAAGKLAEARRRGRISFHRASIAALPFASERFDGVMVNQVLHHLPDDRQAGYPTHRQALLEFARVLRPGGALVVNTCSSEQLRSGFWYYDLIADAATSMLDRHLPLDDMERLLRETGFTPGGRFVPLDAVLQGAAYFNPRGPLDKAWRDGDSIWSTVPSEELQRVVARVRKMERAGTLDTYRAERDAARQRIGQMTFVCARRHRSNESPRGRV